MKNKVYVEGVWDMLHYGHLKFLKEASKYGEVIVGIQTDYFTTRRKRAPILPLKIRRKTLEILGYKTKSYSNLYFSYSFAISASSVLPECIITRYCKLIHSPFLKERLFPF